MKEYFVFSMPYYDENGHKHCRKFTGTVEAKTIASACKKAKKEFRSVINAGKKLMIGAMNYKTGEYEEKIIEK